MIIPRILVGAVLAAVQFRIENTFAVAAAAASESQLKSPLPATSTQSSTSSAANNFLWEPLLSVESEHFRRAFLPSYLNFSRDILASSWISAPCSVRLRAALDALSLRRNWAAKLFNAWAKFPPSGALRGTLTDFGDYDQCLSVGDTIPVQYCLLDFSPPMPPMPRFHNYYQRTDVLPPLPPPAFTHHQKLSAASAVFATTSVSSSADNSSTSAAPISTTSTTASPVSESFLEQDSVYRNLEAASSLFYYVYIQIGVCLPADCSQADVGNISRQVVHHLRLNVNKFQCEQRRLPDSSGGSGSSAAWNLSPVQLGAIVLLLIMVAINTAAALYDRLVRRKSCTLAEQVLLWFSPVRNVAKLVRTRSSSPSGQTDELAAVHGLRFITILWIIVAHTLEWNNLNVFRDTFSIRDRLSQLALQPLYKGHYSVDTFFYLSGLLTSYVSLKYTNGDWARFKVAPFLLLRYLRLTPQLFAFLLLTSLLPPLFSGPLWPGYMAKLTDRCYRTWWHNLVYLQNFIDIENICAVHTWYLAADMQLHFASLLPIILLLRRRPQGIALTKVLILAGVCVSALSIFLQRLPPGSVITSKNNFLDEGGRPSAYISFFYKPWNHASVFFIGLLFGVYVHEHQRAGSLMKMKNGTVVLTKRTKYLLWAITALGYLFCIYSTLPWLYGRPYEPLWSALLYPLNRTLWALVLTSILWLCLTGNGTAFGRLLSWSALRPLSRLTYSVYLTHAWVLWVALGTRRELIDLSARSLALLFGGVLSASFALGFTFTLLFETPLIHALEYIKRRWIDGEDPQIITVGGTHQLPMSIVRRLTTSAATEENPSAALDSKLLLNDQEAANLALLAIKAAKLADS